MLFLTALCCVICAFTKLSSASIYHEAPFCNHTASEILQEANNIVAEEKEFSRYIGLIENPTVANVLVPSMDYENENSWKKDVIEFYKSVSPDKSIREASAKAEIILEQSSIEHDARRDLYEVYSELYGSIKDNSSAVDEESLRFLKRVLTDFERAGSQFNRASQDKIEAVQSELTNLTTRFSVNCNEEDGSILFTRKELAGVPPTVLQQYATVKLKGKIKYKVALAHSDISPILKYCSNQRTRKMAHLAHLNKLPENAKIMEKLVSQRFKLAKLLGYRSYSELVLSEQMAKTPSNVMGFLNDLKRKLVPVAKQEVARLLRIKNEDLAARNLPTQDHLYAWDDSYYTNIMLEREYKIDHEEVSQYFPLFQTVDKILDFYEQLFDITFTREDCTNAVWDIDVFMYAVHQSSQSEESKENFMGWIMFDLFSRDGKFPHAAAFRLHSAFEKPDGSRSPGLTAVICNFAKPTDHTPALLRHGEVALFLHELGHGLHQLLSQTKNVRFQGTQVPKDFVECPSQMLEFWAWSKPDLQQLSGHYLTGEQIPDDLVENLIETKHVNTGLTHICQLIYSLFDMELHTIETEEQLQELDIKKLWNKLFEEVDLISSDGIDTIGYASFGHLVWGYESNYYGYLYSKVFATDIFYSLFKGDTFNVKNGLRFRDIILRNGGAKDIPEILHELLGRAPQSDAFLREVMGVMDGKTRST